MNLLPNIEPFRQRYNELEQKLSDPAVFKDASMASELSREHGRVKVIIETFESIKELEEQVQESESLLSDEEFAETAQSEIISLQKKINQLREELLVAMIPPDPDIGRNTILEIRAGAGGDEASLFAADLYRMYCRYSETKKWSLDCLSQSHSESGGFKEVVFMLKGEDAWAKLKFESGVHRVQRVPVTEASGRIHTSTATVAVLPEAREVEIKIDPSELEISVCRASGPGGQGVNTTDSAVQLLHKPSGITVYCADERSQLKNKSKAMTVLRSRLLKMKQAEEQAKYAKDRKEQVGTGDRSERIRTYNFPQSRITDHRINYTSHALNESLFGELDHLLDALQEADLKLRLDELNNEQ
jgi:peptide chain release factor 1